MSETGVRPRLLSDVPSTVDQLGGHAKVAAAVSETLRRERGGRALALEGDWGAGKSTVVGLVERDFSGPDERMFVFDAWAHQGDPLRRSFLESLTESLLEPVGTTDSWVDEDWRGRLDQLARRRKTTVRKVHTEVREVAKFAALGALLVPLGLLILNREFNPRDHTKPIEWFWVAVGFACALAPLIGIVIGWAARRYNKDKRALDKSLGVKALDPLVGNQNVEESSDTWENPDPTSIEFERTFKELLADALAPEGRRLAIVFDNLDRVDPSDALGILSTMQTFLGTSVHSRDPWRERLWVIVPYDGDGLRRLWDSRVEEQGNGWTGVATEQLDKLFQVTFRVPPMRLSDWRSFLLALLEEALPEEPLDDRQLVHVVYSTYRAENPNAGSDRPTPRKLKHLVNQLVALRLQRSDITLPVMTYFVLCSRYEGDIEEMLTSGKGVTERFLVLLGEDVGQRLAALHYGRDERESLQMLLADRIEQALSGGNRETLLTLSENPGMWDVAETLPFDQWWTDGGETVCQALATLDESGLMEQPVDGPHRTFIAIKRSFYRRPYVKIRTERAGRGLAALAVGPPATPVRSLLAALADPDDAEVRDAAVDSGTAIAGFIGRLPEPLRRDLEGADPVRVSVSASGYLDLAVWLAGHDESLLTSLIMPRLEWPDVDAAMAERIAADPTPVPAAVTVLRAQYADGTFPQAIAAASAVLQQDQPPAGAVAALRILKAFAGLAEAELQALSTAGHLHHHFAVAFLDHNDSEVAAEFGLEILSAAPALPAPPAERRAAEGHTALSGILGAPENDPQVHVTDRFADLVCSEASPEILLQLAQIDASRPFALAVLERVAAFEECETLGATFVAAGWSTLAGLAPPETLVSLAERYRAGGEFERAAVQVPLGNPNASLAMQVLAGELESRDAVVAWTDEYLDAQGADEWREALANGDDRIGILAARLEAKLPPERDHRYEEALVGFIEAVAAGTATVTERLDRWMSRALDALATSRRSVFFDQLASRLAGGPVPVPAFIQTWGRELLERDAFWTTDQALVLLAKTVAGTSPDPIHWAREALERRPGTLHDAAAERRDYFKSNIEDVRGQFTDETDAELRAAVDELANQVERLLRTGGSR